MATRKTAGKKASTAANPAASTAARVRVGIGGWVFKPWRGLFYPPGLAQKHELDYASRQLTSIEINGTFYGLQKPATFAKWRDETPEDFVFSLKAPRFTTHRKVLGEAGESIARFLDSGILELKHKLGPINWQFAPTKQFDAQDFEAFLKLLPKQIGGHGMRHAVEVRHDSFRDAACIALARQHGVAIVVAADSKYPQIAALTAPFVYARVMGTSEAHAQGYTGQALDLWAERARVWARGGMPQGLQGVREQGSESAGDPAPQAQDCARDVYLYVISGFKAHNPAAAMALLARLPGAAAGSA